MKKLLKFSITYLRKFLCCLVAVTRRWAPQTKGVTSGWASPIKMLFQVF